MTLHHFRFYVDYHHTDGRYGYLASGNIIAESEAAAREMVRLSYEPHGWVIDKLSVESRGEVKPVISFDRS
jgi:hypothetical protein